VASVMVYVKLSSVM